MQKVDGRPWYALIAGAVGTMDPDGRVLSELVGREECSEGARFAQVMVINELRSSPFNFLKAMEQLAGDAWHPASLNYFFLRCMDSRAYKLKFKELSEKLTPEQQVPSAAELCFEHAIAHAWEEWWERLTAIMPKMPPELQGGFQAAVQRPMRQELCACIHGIITEMPDHLLSLGVAGYGAEHQFTYARTLEGLTLRSQRFLEQVEARAGALLQSETQFAEQLSARVEQINAEPGELAQDEAGRPE